MSRLKPDERRRADRRHGEEASRASVEELAGGWTSRARPCGAIWRSSRSRGVVRKVHGGAVYCQTALREPAQGPPRRRPAGEDWRSRRPRRRRCSAPGDSLLIDAGHARRPLRRRRSERSGSFTVITNSLAVAAELWNAPHKSDVYLLGGRYLGDGQEMLGPLVGRADPRAAGGPCGADRSAAWTRTATAWISMPRRPSSRAR